MLTRVAVGCGLLIGLGLWFSPVVSAQASAPQSADVVVVGATPGGVAAAVAAAQRGLNVVLVEETNHVGGIVSGGLTNNDIGREGGSLGLFARFRQWIFDYYVQTYGPDSQQVVDCRKGNHYEAHVAEKAYRALLAAEPRVRLLLRQRLNAAQRDGDRLVRIVLDDLEQPGRQVPLAAQAFIDATYEGDLAALAGVEYRVGRESRDTYGEWLAGRIYMRFRTREPLPGSTGEGDAGIQAFCFRIHVTARPDNRVPFEKPATYCRDDYRHLLADILAGKVVKLRDAMQMHPMPNQKFELNSDHVHPDTGIPSESFDLAEENWGWPEADWRQREKIFARYWDYHEGLLWFLANDPQVPEALRQETAQYGFCKDEFVDHRHRPHYLYVRQGRRIVGEYTFTQRDEDPDPATGLPRPQPDAVAVATYPWDSHSVHKFDPAHPGVREGYFYVPHKPLQLPYRILVPKKIDGLLVPVACSASHVGYQTIRMEPVFMTLGEASGIAAWLAIREQVPLRCVPIGELQRAIVAAGGVIEMPAGKNLSPNRPSQAGRPSRTELPTGLGAGSKK